MLLKNAVCTGGPSDSIIEPYVHRLAGEYSLLNVLDGGLAIVDSLIENEKQRNQEEYFNKLTSLVNSLMEGQKIILKAIRDLGIAISNEFNDQKVIELKSLLTYLYDYKYYDKDLYEKICIDVYDLMQRGPAVFEAVVSGVFGLRSIQLKLNINFNSGLSSTCARVALYLKGCLSANMDGSFLHKYIMTKTHASPMVDFFMNMPSLVWLVQMVDKYEHPVVYAFDVNKKTSIEEELMSHDNIVLQEISQQQRDSIHNISRYIDNIWYGSTEPWSQIEALRILDATKSKCPDKYGGVQPNECVRSIANQWIPMWLTKRRCYRELISNDLNTMATCGKHIDRIGRMLTIMERWENPPL